jgi:DNA-directed RNA polymerase subunit beta'
MSRIREVAAKRDKLILDEREKQAAQVQPTVVTEAPQPEPMALPPAE